MEWWELIESSRTDNGARVVGCARAGTLNLTRATSLIVGTSKQCHPLRKFRTVSGSIA